jgi:hypothetical protein
VQAVRQCAAIEGMNDVNALADEFLA